MRLEVKIGFTRQFRGKIKSSKHRLKPLSRLDVPLGKWDRAKCASPDHEQDFRFFQSGTACEMDFCKALKVVLVIF